MASVSCLNTSCGGPSARRSAGIFFAGTASHKMLGIIVLLITVNPAFTGYSWNNPAKEAKNYALSKSSPEFDASMPTEISVLLGQPAFLPCTVHNLNDKLVSWIRSRDLHILTSGKHTFTADPRVDVFPSPEDETWTLRISSSRLSDGGKYECQVNTDPKMNKFFMLTVRERLLKDSPSLPDVKSAAVKASISGPEEQIVKEGSTLTIECKLTVERDRYHPRLMRSAIPNIRWLHNGHDVNYKSERGGISIETDRGDKTGSSLLTVATVNNADSGKYTCTGDGVESDTVLLTVIEGEHTEAMQRDQSSGVAKLFPGNLTLLQIPHKIAYTLLQIILVSTFNFFITSDWIFSGR